MRIQSDPCQRPPATYRAPWLALLLLMAPAVLSARPQSAEDLLDMDLEALSKLDVVSASRQPGPVSRAPATVRVIDAQRIAERGYRTLEQALADLPGFQFRDILGFNSYVFLRGLPSQNNKLLLLVDGVVVNEPNSGGFYAGGHINLLNVERIEVVYGPASALYGTNAVSGIVHVITRAPDADLGTQLRLLAGSLDSTQASVRHAATTGEFAWSLAAHRWRTDKADLRGASGDFNWTDAAENFNDDTTFDARLSWRRWSAGASSSLKTASRASVQRTLDRPLRDDDVEWHIRFRHLWLRHETDPARGWQWRNAAFARDATVLDRTRPVIERPQPGNPGAQQRWYRPGSVVGLESALHLTPHPAVDTVIGLVAERYRMAEAFSISRSASATEWPAAPARPSRIDQDRLGLYAEARWALSPQLQAHVGLRQDDTDDAPPVRTPRLALVYDRGAFNSKLIYGEAFRAPQPWDRQSGLGNPDLAPEDARSLEWSMGYVPSEGTQALLSLYRSRTDGLLVRAFEPMGSRWINADSITTRGLELSLDHQWADWRLWGHYAFVDATDAAGRAVPEIARHTARVGTTWRPHDALQVSLVANHQGARDNPQPIPGQVDRRLGGATLFDARVAYALSPRAQLRLQVENLGDHVVHHPSNLPPSRYRQPGRTVWFYVDLDLPR